MIIQDDNGQFEYLDLIDEWDTEHDDPDIDDAELYMGTMDLEYDEDEDGDIMWYPRMF